MCMSSGCWRNDQWRWLPNHCLCFCVCFVCVASFFVLVFVVFLCALLLFCRVCVVLGEDVHCACQSSDTACPFFLLIFLCFLLVFCMF